MAPTHIDNPYIDFKYGDHYASDYHLLRVSDGSRYNDNLIPTLTDKTAEAPSQDGTYYFGTYYKQKQITINVAFDSVTETDIRAIRNWLNGKEIQPLILDEKSDRQYFAKVTSPPQFKYIAFDELIEPYTSSNVNNSENDNDNHNTTTQVIYKGEGSIQFTCYDPYAYSISPYDHIHDPIIGGELPTTFVLTTNSGVSSGDIIIISGITTITFTQSTSDPITWNSKTGIIRDNHGPIPFLGNALVTLPVGHTIVLSGPASTLTYYNRYY